MNNKFRVFLKGIFDVSPLMIPVVPFGLIFGVLSIDIGFSPIETMGMSLIVFGGASQIVLPVSYTHLTLPTICSV